MILLGSTGSIGTHTLEVAKAFGMKVEVLCAGRNIALLNKQIQDFHPKYVIIQEKDDASKLQAQGAKVFYGQEGIAEVLHHAQSKLIINALVGFAGLYPSFIAMQQQKKLALANKESLVAAGWLFEHYPIIPIDSEHFGIWYLNHHRPIEEIIITASGGAFRDLEIDKIPKQQAKEALKHPNWKMGNKITIDSATMVNKLFEILEARWLFKHQRIDAFIERTSSIHALLSFKDGSLSAHFANPDMKLPISYALDAHQASQTNFISPFDLRKNTQFCFEEINPLRYPLWELKDEILKYPQLGVILNASNEILVQNFLKNHIDFGDIAKNIFKVLHHYTHQHLHLPDLQSIIELDHSIRNYTQTLI